MKKQGMIKSAAAVALAGMMMTGTTMTSFAAGW